MVLVCCIQLDFECSYDIWRQLKQINLNISKKKSYKLKQDIKILIIIILQLWSSTHNINIYTMNVKYALLL